MFHISCQGAYSCCQKDRITYMQILHRLHHRQQGFPHAHSGRRTFGVYDIHEDTATDDHANLQKTTNGLDPPAILLPLSIPIWLKSQVNSRRRRRS